MKVIMTYITDDGKQFDNQFEAKKHECELTEHKWDYYNENMGQQKQQDEKTAMKFCRNCHTQVMVK
jgi:hypothetical protein